MLSSSLEKYLLCIDGLLEKDKEFKSTELAKQMNQSPQKAIQSLQRMHYQKYIVYSPYQPIKLTEQGKEVVRYLQARNALIDEFLDILHLEEKKETEKEAMQQYLSYESLQTLEKFVLFNRHYPEIHARYELLLKREPKVHLLPPYPENEKG